MGPGMDRGKMDLLGSYYTCAEGGSDNHSLGQGLCTKESHTVLGDMCFLKPWTEKAQGWRSSWTMVGWLQMLENLENSALSFYHTVTLNNMIASTAQIEMQTPERWIHVSKRRLETI